MQGETVATGSLRLSRACSPNLALGGGLDACVSHVPRTSIFGPFIGCQKVPCFGVPMPALVSPKPCYGQSVIFCQTDRLGSTIVAAYPIYESCVIACAGKHSRYPT